MNLLKEIKNKIIRMFLNFIFFSFFITYFASPASAETAPISTSELNQRLDLSTGYEDHRTLGERWEFRGIYQLDYNTHYRLQTGLSYNGETGYLNGIYVELGYEKIKDSDYSVRLKFLGNQNAQWDNTYNSIIPYLSWEASDYVVELGLNYRYSFFCEDDLWNIFKYSNADVSEVILYYRLAWSFPTQDDRYGLTIEFKNNHQFYAGNLGAYALFINNSYQLNDRIKIYGNLGYWQTGSIALSATYLKTTLHAGMEVKL